MTAAMDADAQRPPKRFDIWDISLGAPVADIPDEFVDYACGTNGGPPARFIEGWADYRRCPAGPDGLREVHFRYDDELEYVARARRDEVNILRYGGTLVFDQPVIASALISDQGTVEGIRVVSDPRTDIETRKRAYTLKNFIFARFDATGWSCQELPRAEGESPVGNLFIKERCEKNNENKLRLVVENHFYRKAGQTEFNPATREVTQGYFWSSTRFEMFRVAASEAR